MSRAGPALGLAAVLVALACGANHSAERDAAGADRPGADRLAADTLTGVVAVTGADPLTRVVLRPTRSGAEVVLTGPVADTLRAAAGLELWVAGSRAEDGLAVSDFRVRSVDGVPAADGRLELDGGAVVLVTRSGERLRYPSASPALRDLAGSHVWIAGAPGRAPQQWGVLRQH